MMYRFIKRFLDFTISLFAIMIFSPVFLVLFILVPMFLGVPIFFKQKRVGKNNKIFTIRKFRSMNNNKDEFGQLLPDELRLTGFGKFLRKTSLDELPQLFSILVGHMSIVGPRPKTVEEVVFILDDKYIARHYVKPGITGLAVVKGRNSLNPDKAYRYDLEYISNLSIFFDIKIFFKTFLVVFASKGVNSNKSATFQPHYEFWLEKGKFDHEEIIRRKEHAKKIVTSKAKYVEFDEPVDFKALYKRVEPQFNLKRIKKQKY